MQNHEAIIADIRDSGANIVLLQEVTDSNLPVIRSLANSHPYQQICVAHSVGGVAILSDMPFRGAPTCPNVRGSAFASIVTPYGLLSVAALHLHWPWPYGQASQMEALLPQLRDLPRPVLIGGDFNMVPWSHLDRVTTAATDTTVARPVRPSLNLEQIYPMPIDRILIPQGWTGHVQMRDRLGSDHRGMLLRLSSRSQGNLSQ
nr:endonuclease/exonuclease/phosphatase family protein [Paracoccus amoyensis]